MSCSKQEPTPIDNNEVIISAKSISFLELTEVEKNILKQKTYSENFCCFPNNWNSPENCKDLDSAYFVRVKLHARLLALVTESKTFDINYLLSDNTNTLYGKYKNRWELLDKNDISICKTEKFEGFNNVYIIRNNNVDDILLGPINEIPYKLKIKISNSKNYPNIEPEILIQ